jgi:hypothetical protein
LLAPTKDFFFDGGGEIFRFKNFSDVLMNRVQGNVDCPSKNIGIRLQGPKKQDSFLSAFVRFLFSLFKLTANLNCLSLLTDQEPRPSQDQLLEH